MKSWEDLTVEEMESLAMLFEVMCMPLGNRHKEHTWGLIKEILGDEK